MRAPYIGPRLPSPPDQSSARAMAGGDSSSAAVVAREGKPDRRLRKKQKQEEQQPAAEAEAEEDKGVNTLNPRFSEYDPKQREFVYTRFPTNRFDLDLESPVGPMHLTDKIFKEGFQLCNSVNIVSIKIVSSDYGYPLNVYGTVIARDSMDRKCVYIFRCGKDNCQFIRSKDDSLILTGPKRGLLICDSVIFEIDLKVNDVHGRTVKDERLSKGLLEVDGIFRLSFKPKYKVETKTLVGMHSILDLNYTFVRNAVEGTFEIRILEGPTDFHGTIVARTTSFPCDIVLHDTKLSGMLTAGDNGVMQTVRRAVGVSVDEMLLLTVAAGVGGDEYSVGIVQFTPRRNGYDEEKMTCGNYKMQVKVTWSIVYF